MKHEIMRLAENMAVAMAGEKDAAALIEARTALETEVEKLTAERDAYAKAADSMAASHKVERDALTAANKDLQDWFDAIKADHDALKDAARLALVALNGVVDFDPDKRAQWSVSGGSIEAHECNAAITALKAVL